MIYAVAHSKGGVGKTTVALNLAAAIKPDLIIDLDAHQSVAILNRLREKPLPVTICEKRSELLQALKLSEQGKTILIDCGGFDSDVTRLAIAAADMVIAPASGAVTTRIGVNRFDNVLAEISAEMGTHITAHILITKVHPAKRRFESIDEFLSNAKHMTRLNTILPTRQAYDDAAELGLGVIEHKQKDAAKAAKEIRALAKEIRALAAE